MIEKSSTLSDKDIATLESSRIKNPGYYREIDRLFGFLVPPKMRVLELGCGTGRLLASVNPSYGLGVDINVNKIEAAKQIHYNRPEIVFRVGDAEKSPYYNEEAFDYIILSDLTSLLKDVQQTFSRLQSVCHPGTRILIHFHSHLWSPILSFASFIGRRQRVSEYNWLSMADIRNLLYLSGYEVVTTGGRILLPLRIPLFSWIFNRIIAKLPIIRQLCLSWYVVARPVRGSDPSRSNKKNPSVSIIIPTRNEKGTIEDAFVRTPAMGSWCELVFIDGNSTDGTVEAIKEGMSRYGEKWDSVTLHRQTGAGKGQAVHQGLMEAKGDILMILDSDLTMPPEELPKYYDAMVSGSGEFINGCRLVYAREKEAMRFLNMVANHSFAMLFSWLLGQPIKDTLCGTKVFWKKDYDLIYSNRAYFGDFDPFGDFDFLFGASKLNLKIVDMPIHYRARTYGDVRVNYWKSGPLLLRMSFVALWKLKIKS